MRIGTITGWQGTTDAAEAIAAARRAASAGLDSLWVPQMLGLDALSAVAAIAATVPDIEIATGVVPVYTRHPFVMASQAHTVQQLSGDRFTLGIGTGHQETLRYRLGLEFDRPLRYMREYLVALRALSETGKVNMPGEPLFAKGPLTSVGRPFPIMLGALAPGMLQLAGELADGTVTWMCGPKTLGDHIVPRITRATEQAQRPDPRVVAILPIAVTSDVDGTRAKAAEIFGVYAQLRSYEAMLDVEGAASAGDIAIVGDEDSVAAQLDRLASCGVTDFVGIEFLNDDETRDALVGYRDS